MPAIYTDSTTGKQVYDQGGQKIDVSTGNPLAAPVSTAGVKTLSGAVVDQNTGALLSGPTSITSTSLQGGTPISYTSPNPSPIYPSSNVDTTTATTLSAPEQNISDVAKRLSELYASDTGKTQYTADQEKQYGLQTLTDTQTSLSKQILALQADAKSIPDQMQLQATGRGITAAGLAPLTTAALRENSIKANILGAQLDAAKLDVASAQAKIDKAVKMKFGPMEEEITAAKANLETLLKDPLITLAEKNRANAQLEIQKQKEADIATQKQNAQDIWTVSTTAASHVNSFTPTTQYQTAAQAIQAISSAPTKEAALAIAEQAGLAEGKTKTTQVIEANGRKILIDSTTGQTIKDLGSSTSTTNKTLTAPQYAKLKSTGVDQTLADQITTAILSGHPLDEIRQYMRDHAIDPASLDKFDNIVGISTLLKGQGE